MPGGQYRSGLVPGMTEIAGVTATALPDDFEAQKATLAERT